MRGEPAPRWPDIGYPTLHEVRCVQGQQQLASNTLFGIPATVVLVVVHQAVGGQSQRSQAIPECGSIVQEGAKRCVG